MPATNLTVIEKAEIVLICGDNYKTVREAADMFNLRHPDKHVSYSTVSRILNRFKETGSLEVSYKKPHGKTVLTEENELAVLQTVIETPKISTKRISEQVDVKRTSVKTVLHKYKYHAYKPQYVNKLYDNDFNQRFGFSAWIQGQIEENRNFAKNILFTDESTFTTNGVVCSQNCRWWAQENPNFVIDHRDQRYQKTNVWCGIFNQQIVGPFFFRENLNGQRYLQFLQTNIQDFINELPLNSRINMWLQHDGCPAHSTRDVSNWLDAVCPNRWIGRYSEYNWPPRSPDLSPLDFFLWGYLKEKVYNNRPFENLEALENAITECVREIPGEMVAATINEFCSRTIKCIERNGGHVETVR